MKKTAKTILSLTAFLFLSLSLIFLQTSFASDESDVGFDYEIGDGELFVDIVNEETGNTVATPVVNFGEGFFSNDPITSTGTLGTAEESIRVFNYTVEPKWELTLAAENTANAWSTLDSSESYPYNDSTDVNNGRLTVDPQTGVRSSDVVCATDNINQGSQETFELNEVDSITLLTAPVDVPNYCRFDFQNISLSQIVPGSQAVGTYTLPMVLTITGGNTEYPSEPQNLTVDFENGGNAVLNWDEPATGGELEITGYQVESSNSPWVVIHTTANAATRTFTDTDPGVNPKYRVSAVTHLGVSPNKTPDVNHTITYVSSDIAHGSVSPSTRLVPDGGKAPTPTTTPVVGYVLSNFGITVNPENCTGFIAETGVCPTVTGDMTIQANFEEDGPVACTSGMDIGTECGGGILAYHDGSGGGLIAATADQSTGIQWGCYGTLIEETLTAYGTGLDNTNRIMSRCATTPIAASVARDYGGGGYDDWFLPSKDELNYLYVNRGAIGGFNTSGVCYWSSSEVNSNIYRSWPQRFSDGSQSASYGKVASFHVRAVRFF